jgi:hypothetical protein
MEKTVSQKNLVTICNKQNLLLQVDKNTGIYSLEFQSENNKFNFDELITFGIYNLMTKLNSDLIERIEIIKTYSENEIDVLFVFKKIGAELGLAQKYMAMKTRKRFVNNNIYLTSNHIDYSKNNFQGQGYGRIEPIICELSEIIIYNTHLSNLDLYYRFKINTYEDLPIYMENYIGLMMKKIFYNLKLFIDNFDNNNNNINKHNA